MIYWDHLWPAQIAILQEHNAQFLLRNFWIEPSSMLNSSIASQRRPRHCLWVNTPEVQLRFWMWRSSVWAELHHDYCHHNVMILMKTFIKFWWNVQYCLCQNPSYFLCRTEGFLVKKIPSRKLNFNPKTFPWTLWRTLGKSIVPEFSSPCCSHKPKKGDGQPLDSTSNLSPDYNTMNKKVSFV